MSDEVVYCDDCDITDDHSTGSILCPHTADSCGICGGYHDSFYNCLDEMDDDDDDDVPA